MTLLNEVNSRINGPQIATGSGKAAIFWNVGKPSNGTISATGYNFASKASICCDTNAARLYVNTGTGAEAPTWDEVVTAKVNTTGDKPVLVTSSPTFAADNTTRTYIPLYTISSGSGTLVWAWGSAIPTVLTGSAAGVNGWATGSLYTNLGVAAGTVYVCVGTSPQNHNWIVLGTQA